MTYLNFLLIFIVVPIVVMVAIPRPVLRADSKRVLWSIPALCAIAFAYTTPWDNYLVYNKIWYYGIDRVIATIGYVPVEEYLFFLLQPVLTGLFIYHVYSRSDAFRDAVYSKRKPDIVLGLYVIGSALGIAFLAAGGSATYMGLILSWACPVLAGLWYAGYPLFMRHAKAFAISVSVPTLYLWVCDIYAMRSGIWTISDDTSFDIDPFGLPIEEATFFLVTNLLIVQGVLLFVYGDRLPRLLGGSDR